MTENKKTRKPATANTGKSKPQEPKKRHRRTMAELLADPAYRKSKGLDPLPADDAGRKEDEPQPEKPSAEEGASPAKSTLYRMEYGRVRSTYGFKRMFPCRWLMDVWDTRSEECVASIRMPDSVIDADDAYEYAKKYCNQNMPEVAGRNVVLHEIAREFRVNVTQIETME